MLSYVTCEDGIMYVNKKITIFSISSLLCMCTHMKTQKQVKTNIVT